MEATKIAEFSERTKRQLSEIAEGKPFNDVVSRLIEAEYGRSWKNSQDMEEVANTFINDCDCEIMAAIRNVQVEERIDDFYAVARHLMRKGIMAEREERAFLARLKEAKQHIIRKP